MNQEKLINLLDSIKSHNESTLRYVSNKDKEYDHSDILAFSVKTEGYSGGSCYGTRTSHYYVDHEDRVAELASEINYIMNLYLGNHVSLSVSAQAKEFAERYVSNEIESYSDYNDFYGNGSDYIIVSIPLNEFLAKVIEPQLLIDEQDFIASYQKNTFDAIEKKQLQKQYDSVIEKIELFEKTKNNEFNSINKELERLKNSVLQLEKKSKLFEKSKDKELKSLLTQKEQLEAQGVVVVPSQKIKKVNVNL
jgi:hypothetical protein